MWNKFENLFFVLIRRNSKIEASIEEVNKNSSNQLKILLINISSHEKMINMDFHESLPFHHFILPIDFNFKFLFATSENPQGIIMKNWNFNSKKLRMDPFLL